MRAPVLVLVLACSVAGQIRPAAVGILPANGATGVPLNAPVIVALSFGSYFQTPITLTRAGVAISGATHFAPADSVSPPPGASGFVIFTPDKPLDPKTSYNIAVIAPSAAPLLSSFTTGIATDNSPLQLLSSDPSPGQDAVSTAGSMTLRFNKPVSPASFKREQFDLRELGSGTVNYPAPQIQPDGSTVVFNFSSFGSAGLILGRAYQFEFASSGLTDWLGNPFLPFPAPIRFTTFRSTEKDGPILVGAVPADGEAGVAINSSIVLIFDKPLAQLPFDGGITLDSGGPAKFKIDGSVAGGRALVIQPAFLLAPNSQITLRVTGLVDVFGAPLSGPITISFRTGNGAETRPLQVSEPPPSQLTKTAAIRITFNRAIDPLLLSLGGVGVYAIDNNVDHVSPPYQISDDHRRVTISPEPPLPAGVYRAQISIPFDRTHGKLQAFGVNFTVSGEVDTTPPQVAAVTPPDGVTDAPPSSLIQVAFSEPVAASSPSANPFQLLKDGNAVPGAFSISGVQGSFVPKTALQASTTYRLQISGLTDLSGNPLSPFASSFTTAGTDAPKEPFQVIGVMPALNAAADPASQIVLTFNRTVNPVSVLQQNIETFLIGRLNSINLDSIAGIFSITGTFQVSGATVTFTPASQLPLVY